MSSWALKEFMDCASIINDDQGKAVPVPDGIRGKRV